VKLTANWRGATIPRHRHEDRFFGLDAKVEQWDRFHCGHARAPTDLPARYTGRHDRMDSRAGAVVISCNGKRPQHNYSKGSEVPVQKTKKRAGASGRSSEDEMRGAPRLLQVGRRWPALRTGSNHTYHSCRPWGLLRQDFTVVPWKIRLRDIGTGTSLGPRVPPFITKPDLDTPHPRTLAHATRAIERHNGSPARARAPAPPPPPPGWVGPTPCEYTGLHDAPQQPADNPSWTAVMGPDGSKWIAGCSRRAGPCDYVGAALRRTEAPDEWVGIWRVATVARDDRRVSTGCTNTVEKEKPEWERGQAGSARTARSRPGLKPGCEPAGPEWT